MSFCNAAISSWLAFFCNRRSRCCKGNRSRLRHSGNKLNSCFIYSLLMITTKYHTKSRYNIKMAVSLTKITTLRYFEHLCTYLIGKKKPKNGLFNYHVSATLQTITQPERKFLQSALADSI